MKIDKKISWFYLKFRPQNLKKSPTRFEVYLVNVKSSEGLFQIFVAFSECPNFIIFKNFSP